MGFEDGVYQVTAELWITIASRARLLSPEGCFYLETWSSDDPFVAGLFAGTHSTTAAAADLGGWLADYCNTVLRVAMHGVRPDAKYVVIDNALYASLARMTFYAALFINGGVRRHLGNLGLACK